MVDELNKTNNERACVRRLTIALTCVVLAGPLLAAGLGTVWISRQRQAARESLESLLDLRLRAAAIPIEKLLTSYRPRLENAIEEFFANSAQRETSQPLVATHFALDAGGRLIQPSEIEPLLSALLIEQPWLTDRSGEEPDIPNEPDPEEEPKAEPPPPSLPEDPEIPGQWTALFVGPGLQLYYWRRLATGEVQGVVLRRGRWMADIIAELPDTPMIVDESAGTEQLRLVDASKGEVYAWGDVSSEAEMWSEIALSEPLSSWRLQYWAESSALAPALEAGSSSAAVFALGALVISLAGLGIYVFRETMRQYRLAQQQVSFVGQISHEFRTPLTNIRLYAELLERDATDDGAGRKAGVIRTESERLGRLITNVLELSRSGSSQRRLQRIEEIPDAVIERVLQSFEPSFASRGVRVVRHGNAHEPALLDSDVLEQVLVNLLSNVEKYALSGRFLQVDSWQSETQVMVRVMDHGPGIPKRLSERVFEPFVRGSNAINAPAGMGIGLSIARSLAVAHGGRIQLEPTSQGASFLVELNAPKVQATVDFSNPLPRTPECAT